VVLHGHSSTPEAAAGLAAAVDPAGAFHHVAPQGPLELGDRSFAWFDDAPGSLAAARRSVRALLDGLVADAGRPLVVVGFSQGGAAAVAALTGPAEGPLDGLIGLAVVNGFVAEAADVEQDLSLLAEVPVLVQHGRHDGVVPFFFAEDLATSLDVARAVVATDWRDAGHERTPEGDAVVGEWLRAVGLGEA
jgi:predicted esterase